MELSDILKQTVENAMEINLSLESDRRLDLLKSDLSSNVQKAVDRAANYVIKAMPVPDAIKDILIDIKEAVKTKDLKKVISTAVKSSVREGLELLGVYPDGINNIMDLKNIATKGGLATAIKNGIDIVATNFLKNNIVGDYVYKFFDKLKEYVLSNRFMQKIDSMLNNLLKRKDDFMNKCNEWYEAYKNMDITTINDISEKLSENKYVLQRYDDCAKENKVIQNMTSMINNNKTFLSANQQRLCQAM